LKVAFAAKAARFETCPRFIVVCGALRKDLQFFIHIIRDPRCVSMGSEEAEGRRRFWLGNLDRLHGWNRFRRLCLQRLFRRGKLLRTHFGLCSFPSNVRLGLGSASKSDRFRMPRLKRSR